MNSKVAKDFLVQQTVEQAAIQGIPLSDLEMRMMYFTEWDDSCENPIQLNEEFEAKCDTAEYEAKIASLLKNSYKRIKQENPETKRIWDEAIKKLSKEDHYILVLWRATPKSEHPQRDFFIQVGIGVLIAFLFAAGLWIKLALEKR